MVFVCSPFGAGASSARAARCPSAARARPFDGASLPALARRSSRRFARSSRPATYLVSRWRVWVLHQRQYFLNSTRSGVFRFDLLVW
jgi:hypothetical protein